MSALTNSIAADQEIDAMTRDISVLFTNFDKKESIRFEDFSDTWKELNFSFIHSARNTMNAKIKATRRLMRIVISYFSPETPFQFRIAAIYSAYALYYTQLCTPKVKIRMTPTMWKDLEEIHDLVRKHEHLDVDFVIQKLIDDKAFIYTAMPTPLEYGRKEFMLNIEPNANPLAFKSSYRPDEYVVDLLQNLDPIEKVAQLEDEYAEVKKKIMKDLWQDKDGQVPKSLTAVEENFHSCLLNETEEFQEWLEVNTTYGKEIVDKLQRPVPKPLKIEEEKKDNSKETQQQEQQPRSPTRAERIAALKKKSFAHVGKDRHNDQLASDLDNSEKKASDQPKKIVHYRRSALREEYCVRSWQKSWKRTRDKPLTKQEAMEEFAKHVGKL